MSKRKQSIYSVTPAIFAPESPINKRHVIALFCGRDTQLTRGVEVLKAHSDVGGRISRLSDKRPWAIHGESRSGKSHLARRILAELPKNADRIQCDISARGKQEALPVLRMLFEQLWGEFSYRAASEAKPPEPKYRQSVEAVRQLMERIALFQPGDSSIEISAEVADKANFDASGELGLSSLLGKFLAKYARERTNKNTVKITMRPMSEDDIVAVCKIIMECIVECKLARHALILIDDIDLLEGSGSEDQNSRRQRTILASAISDLHFTRGLDVLLTARSWYVNSQKELQTLVDLTAAPMMSSADLVEIHNRRLRIHGKGQLSSFLESGALAQVAADCDGLPGVFLKHIQSLFYRAQEEGSLLQRGPEWVDAVFRSQLEFASKKCVPAAEALRSICAEGKQNYVTENDRNPFYGSLLENEFVYQSYYDPRTWFVSGIARRLLGPSRHGATQ